MCVCRWFPLQLRHRLVFPFFTFSFAVELFRWRHCGVTRLLGIVRLICKTIRQTVRRFASPEKWQIGRMRYARNCIYSLNFGCWSCCFRGWKSIANENATHSKWQQRPLPATSVRFEKQFGEFVRMWVAVRFSFRCCCWRKWECVWVRYDAHALATTDE